MTIPDWLVERAALDEVAPHVRDRVARADAAELAKRIAALRENNAAELAEYPAGPAVAQIEARAASERRRRNTRKTRAIGLIGVAAAAALALFLIVRPREDARVVEEDEITRPKGTARLLAFRLAEDHVEQLQQDATVRAGDVIQLRYNAGGKAHGLIASIDGAGVVTLHFPASESASTALAAKPTALPNAYALDDAPRFERFFFITADRPIDIPQAMDALRTLAGRGDSDTASLELRVGLHQWSLRLRKEDRHD